MFHNNFQIILHVHKKHFLLSNNKIIFFIQNDNPNRIYQMGLGFLVLFETEISKELSDC